MASIWIRARGALMAASWVASASTWRRVARRVVARRRTIISSSTPSTRATGGIRATPRAATVGSAWATLSTKLTPAAPASSSLGHHTSHQARRALVVVNHRSAPRATTMKESTIRGTAQPCSGAMPLERTAYSRIASKLV
jgi:hypothetical protein